MNLIISISHSVNNFNLQQGSDMTIVDTKGSISEAIPHHRVREAENLPEIPLQRVREQPLPSAQALKPVQVQHLIIICRRGCPVER